MSVEIEKDRRQHFVNNNVINNVNNNFVNNNSNRMCGFPLP